MNEREKMTVRASPVTAPVAAVAASGMALLLSFTTALGTSSLTFWARTAYWLMEIFAGAVVIAACLWLIRGVPAGRVYLRAALVFIMSAPVITVFVWLTTEWVTGHDLQSFTIAPYIPGVLSILGFNAFMQIMVSKKTLTDARLADGGVTSPAARRPVEIVDAIEAQAHYVIFHTDKGPTRRLMRFSDAIAGVAAPGFQTHRSWWVATDSIRRVDFDKRRIELNSGMTVPIARAKIAPLKSALKG